LKTAQHIYKQKYLRIGFLGLKLVSAFNISCRRQIELSNAHRRESICMKVLKGFRIIKLLKIKNAEMVKLSE
jgi:hypothetical protein